MITRKMESPDWMLVEKFKSQYAFEWKFPEYSNRVASACVVEDDAGGTVALCAAELVPSVTLAMNQSLHPTVRLRAGGMIHAYLHQTLLDYPELHCEVPPELEGAYGRHLERIFGWREMWKGYKLKGSPTI